jgi:C4-dicarboxylate transporter DctQ subunit
MSSLFNFLEQIDGFLVRMEKVLIIFVLFLLIVLSLGQVIARNFFQLGFMWIDELSRCLVLWLAFIGGALCSKYARHMRIDIILHLMKGQKKLIVEIIGNVFIIIVCAFLLVASINHIIYQMESSIKLMLQGVPDWIISLVIPYFFAVTMFRAIMRIKKDILKEEHVELPHTGSGDLNGGLEQALPTK